jgi:hypothetical protein
MADLGDRIEEAKYRVIEEEKADSFDTSVKATAAASSSNLPATLESLMLTRHPLMQTKITPEIEKIQTELQVDKELGLKAQAASTSRKSLIHDIDELTKSNNYFQVTKPLLRRLFQMNRLFLTCLLTNIRQFRKAFASSCMIPVMLSILTLGSIPLLVWASAVVFGSTCTWMHITEGFFVVFGWIGAIITGCFAVYHWAHVTMEWETVDVELMSKALSDVDVSIPLGAKLKVLEAKRTEIFENFIYVHPLFSVNQHVIDVKKYIPRVTLDPAILGVTKDGRMYMIVYWDLKHDVEHVLNQIKDFKKFKVAV